MNPQFDDQAQLAFEFAKELAIQLITLSTGIITFAVIFAKDVLKTVTPRGRQLLGAAWVGYLLSMLAGLASLMTLTGNLLDWDPRPEGHVTIGWETKYPAIVQILSFVIATGVVGFFALWYAPRGDPSPSASHTKTSAPE